MGPRYFRAGAPASVSKDQAFASHDRPRPRSLGRRRDHIHCFVAPRQVVVEDRQGAGAGRLAQTHALLPRRVTSGPTTTASVRRALPDS